MFSGVFCKRSMYGYPHPFELEWVIFNVFYVSIYINDSEKC